MDSEADGVDAYITQQVRGRAPPRTARLTSRTQRLEAEAALRASDDPLADSA